MGNQSLQNGHFSIKIVLVSNSDNFYFFIFYLAGTFIMSEISILCELRW